MHTGSCHCGRVTFEVDGDFSEVYECNCSHCSRKGFLLWFVPATDFRLLSGEDATTTYLFNKHVIQHRFCTTCGCQAYATGTAPDGTATVGVNVRCLEDVELENLKRVSVDGRSL